MDREILQSRGNIIRKVRNFFENRGYLEVDTPLLAPDLIPESCLEVFETRYKRPGGGIETPYWLIPSPEIWMKKLIAENSGDIFQICRCFRNGESVGRIHSPEFTMLEYYSMDAGYFDSLEVTEELFRELNAMADLAPPFRRITLEEAFAEWAGIDLFKAAEQGALSEEAMRLGLEPPRDMTLGDIYNLIFVHQVEPNLPRDVPVALIDYPAFVPCLAKKSPDGRTVERWELYVRGTELANCFSEENNPEEVRRFFESEGEIKSREALTPHGIDENYWKIFDNPGGKPFPRCSGVAMGLDRLIMVLLDRRSLEGILPFPMT